MPELKFITAFKLGARVCLAIDDEDNEGIIISIKKNWNGGVYYEVKFADDMADWYQSLELEEFPRKDKNKKPKIKKDEDDDDNEGDVPK